MRPECPLCVTRKCANCFLVDRAVNRKWLASCLPGGECRRCGAAKAAVTEVPVRHYNVALTEEHTQYFNEPPVERDVHDPAELYAAVELLKILDGVFWSAYDGARRLPTDDDRDADIASDYRARNWNEGTAALLKMADAVRRWSADHPVLPLGYSVVGDNDADGDSVYLYCARCPREDVTVVVPGTPSLGKQIGRFLTNVWDEPPTELTVADLVKITRKHDREVHGGEAG